MELDNFSGQDLARLPSTERGEVRVVTAPLVRASEESLAGCGRLVPRFDPNDVTIVAWPVRGRRPLVPGTGVEGGVVVDRFEMERRGAVQYATNLAVKRHYLTGWLGDPATTRDGDPPRGEILLTHEANYHPDGGQIFFPRDRGAFIALLAPPGDDVRAEDFSAFFFDGSCGVHIDPGVWHQPVYPLAERASFDDAQGRVHACVSIDFVGELGCYLGLPLRAP